MPKLEEISDDDIDNMDMDLAQFDPSLKTHIAPKVQPTVTKSTNYDEEPPLFPNIPMQNPPSSGNNNVNVGSSGGRTGIPMLVDQDGNPVSVDEADFPLTSQEEMKTLQIIYPCYFDINRSQKEGRRVPKDLAVQNPLAKTISDACIRLGLKTVLEPDKTHPQDFGNSGRVRVLIKKDSQSINSMVKNKRVLIKKVGVYLKKNPTTLQSVKQLKLPNFDPQLQAADFQPQRVPRVKGFKMNDIVPLHSPFLMGHPQLKGVYTKEPEVTTSTSSTPSLPQMPKKKILKVRR
ncbi:RNA-binding signal recognition particle subunit [Saccharomycopsis crataegensis]|uniref:RNA-binding signal recognition particle subunit n=1 Tax=Saccharomycopsis crataegensis TaxID=43959 RepID=A0AAV5QEB5_9ASCO|nr:RNA-binding signal recognition particle subunit [Saccharomycopsis crataegensis]